MWKYTLSLLLVIAGAFIIAPRVSHEPTPEALSPQVELSMKQVTLNQDVARTDELCRTQCSYELRRIVTEESKTNETKNWNTVLSDIRKNHPHMVRLIYTRNGEALDQGKAAGELHSSVSTLANPFLIEAKKAVDSGHPYQSATFQAENAQFFVLGEPSAQGGSGIVGVIQQNILNEVTDHQRKNLRLTTYPAQGRYKTESVDSKSLQNVNVKHPEDNQGISHYHQNQVVVKFRRDPSDRELTQIRSEIGGGTVHKLGYTYVFESNGMEAKTLMNYFQKWNVEYAEPHYLYLTNEMVGAKASPNDNTSVTPNDALYSRYQWNLPQIETEAGWNVTKGSQDITVAVIDTGVDLNHPDLKDQLVSGFNVFDPNAGPQDDVGHGTHVAGVIGALVNNNLGVAGMSWYNRIMPVKVLDSTGAGSTYAVAQGIIWATDHGAKVINMSLGNYADAAFLHDAIRYAYDRDVVLIAASGNDNTEQSGYPAAYNEVFAVAAADSRKQKASFSNYGDYIDVTAPGVSIASTYPHNQYAALSGTSMASPHVTALAALIRSANPALKNTEVMQIMRDTAQDLGPTGKDKYFGYGLIDVRRALLAAQPKASAAKEPTTVPQDTTAPVWPDWLRRMLGT